VDVDEDDELLDADGGLFEAELALLDELEADVMRTVGDGPEAVATSTRWSRPLVPSFHPVTDALVFQQFDIDFHTGVFKANFHGSVDWFIDEGFLIPFNAKWIISDMLFLPVLRKDDGLAPSLVSDCRCM